MEYTIETSAYNERRYGKPWLGIVTTHLAKDFTFIDWDGRPGYAGEFNFEVEPGTMIARGQKDLRKGRGGVDAYYILMPDGGTPINTSHLSKPDAVIRKMPPSERWRYAVQERLDYWASQAGSSLNYQDAIKHCARYAAMLGVPDPLAAMMAANLGLIAAPESEPQSCPVSMDAFGL